MLTEKQWLQLAADRARPEGSLARVEVLDKLGIVLPVRLASLGMPEEVPIERLLRLGHGL